jgi:hypothetical protein
MSAEPRNPERPLELGIMYAHTCNIACRHCGILSGPRNHARMPLDLAERYIREAAALDERPSTLVFTGGEPFVFLKELEHLLGLCNRMGLSTRVVTNGFWARNEMRARRILHRLRLAGLDAINFSADKFHLEFLDPAILRRAIAIAQEVGFVAIVNYVFSEPGDPVSEFASMYGIPIENIRPFYESEFIRQVRTGTVPPEVGEKINLSWGRLVGLGRAAEYPEEHFLSALESFDYSPCQEVVNRPVLYPNGDLQACCCAGGKIAAFCVGNLKAAPLAQLLHTMRQRSHYRFINTFGPRHLYEAVSAARPDRPKRERHASICDVCVAATRGLCAEEADRITEQWVLSRLLRTDLPEAVDERAV